MLLPAFIYMLHWNVRLGNSTGVQFHVENVLSCQDSLVPLFPMRNASSRLSCSHCISGIPTSIWRVEFKVEELAFWMLLNLLDHLLQRLKLTGHLNHWLIIKLDY